MNKLYFGASALLLSAGSMLANNEDAASIKTKIDTITTNAQTVFNTIVPIVVASVALGVLIAFVKRVKKS